MQGTASQVGIGWDVAAGRTVGGWSRVRGTPGAVAASVLLIYGLWLTVFFVSGKSVWTFAGVGREHVLAAHSSSVIKLYPYGQYSNAWGYDGQFYYFIALDPVHARDYIPDTVDQTKDYRYTRILYPMVARLLAVGRADLIPYTLVLVNLLAITGGALALAAWLRRKQLSPWFALIFGLCPGIFIALVRDVTEPLAFGLVALAVYLYDAGGRRRILWCGICYALAVLSRESVAVFPLVHGIALLIEDRNHSGMRRWLRGGSLLTLAIGPILLYKLFLWLWLGPPKLPPNARLQLIPLHGLVAYWPAHAFDRVDAAVTVVVPALICAGMALWALWKGVRRVEVWMLLANIQLFVVMLNPNNYMDPSGFPRHAAGVVLAALYCLPVFDVIANKRRGWLWASSALWLLPAVFWLVLTPALLLLS